MSRPLLATLANIDAFHASVSREGSPARLVRTAADIPTTPDGNVHYILHLEGAARLKGSLSALRYLYRLGVRSMQLTWNVRNELADGVIDGRTGGGLSEQDLVLGRAGGGGPVVDPHRSHAQARVYRVGGRGDPRRQLLPSLP